tara:strand:- start:423 stop:866 length:444 start_codon:yes stop_codon:yes gene_type:complete
MSFKDDLNFGLDCELSILKKIRSFFGRDIIKTVNKFDKFDYTDNRYNYELKSRKCNYETYKTTIIACDKLKDKSIYLFNFNNELYYIKYDKKKFEKFEKKEFVRPPRPDKIDVKKMYVYIPIEKLKKINLIDNLDKIKIENEFKIYI